MLRNLGIAVLASTLLLSSGASAFAADQAALAPGKPAGVKHAAMVRPIWWWVAGVGFVAGGLAFALSGNSNGSSSGSTPTTHGL